MRTTSRDEIRSIAEERDVRFLLHFTQIANLGGIVKHGLLPRRDLAGPEYFAYASDHYRLDENDHAVSVSISRVNEAMFASKRRKSGHPNWAVLVLPAHILWTHNCLFSWRNAATKEIKGHRGWRGGPWAFGKMFAGSNEARSGLAPSCPTDPEAEVQVLDAVAAEYILGAVVNRPEMVEGVQAILNELPGGQRLVVNEN
ncbi:MAG: DUF4433 domain-containing protein [Proteobacteria bacterium]|nr:DUF4433 domain-containing protein [Pseudomonadota bacterium]